MKNLFGMITTKSSVEYTPVALSSFVSTTPLSAEDRFILIDNDGSYSGPVPDPVELRVNTQPLGFAANMNRILSEAHNCGANAILLNNDLLFLNNWFDPLCRNQQVITSPLSNRERPYETPRIKCPVEMQLADVEGKEAALEELLSYHRASSHGYMNVFMVPFFAVFLPHPVILRLGKLDELYGRGGGEDYDYCFRALLAGFKVQYALESYIIHFGGKSSWSGAESKQEQGERETTFKARFHEKWGEMLLNFALDVATPLVKEGSPFRTLAEQGRYDEALRLVLGSRVPELKI